ncbi:hypothetical protein Lal_00000977 [Lupinus albus]|nr:hypothetical protein Lal_00000977 [Lupinus albus]
MASPFPFTTSTNSEFNLKAIFRPGSKDRIPYLNETRSRRIILIFTFPRRKGPKARNAESEGQGHFQASRLDAPGQESLGQISEAYGPDGFSLGS